MKVNARCPNCNSFIPNEQPSVNAGLSFSASDSVMTQKRYIQCPACACLLEDTYNPDHFTRRLFLTISMVIVLNIMTTLAFGSSAIADVMLAIMVASLMIALPLCVFRWIYLHLFQARPQSRYRQIDR